MSVLNNNPLNSDNIIFFRLDNRLIQKINNLDNFIFTNVGVKH